MARRSPPGPALLTRTSSPPNPFMPISSTSRAGGRPDQPDRRQSSGPAVRTPPLAKLADCWLVESISRRLADQDRAALGFFLPDQLARLGSSDPRPAEAPVIRITCRRLVPCGGAASVAIGSISGKRVSFGFFEVDRGILLEVDRGLSRCVFSSGSPDDEVPQRGTRAFLNSELRSPDAADDENRSGRESGRWPVIPAGHGRKHDRAPHG